MSRELLFLLFLNMLWTLRISSRFRLGFVGYALNFMKDFSSKFISIWEFCVVNRRTFTSCLRSGGEGHSERRRCPNYSDICRAVVGFFHCVSSCRVRRLSVWFHHGGHFNADVFRHRRPCLPFLHHLHSVMILLVGHAGLRCPGQRMRDLPLLHPWLPSRTTVWQHFITHICNIFCMQ